MAGRYWQLSFAALDIACEKTVLTCSVVRTFRSALGSHLMGAGISG